MNKEEKHYLFSYGTLQYEKVQLENYGRLLKGNKDKLRGYRLTKVEITDVEVLKKSGTNLHPIAVKSANAKSFIEGVLFEITTKELEETDRYEVSDYIRKLETFESGVKGWIYVSKTE